MAKKYNNNLNGIINIYKEKDFTSHDVVAIVRKITQSKAGHTGTLDPNAEGVLPVCLGKCTKLSDYIMAEEKVYRAELILGITTDTEDSSGNILREQEVKSSREDIDNVINSFVGEYYQTPPMYSAIKIDGKKLYDLAREGQIIERKKRLVNIKDIKIIDQPSKNTVIIDVKCSKGTYIRTLCSDIGKELHCGAHMGNLIRLKTGSFDIKNSIKIDGLKTLYSNGEIEKILLKPEDVLLNYKKIYIAKNAQNLLINGNKINSKFINEDVKLQENEHILVYSFENQLVGIYKTIFENNQQFIKPITMLM